MTKELFSTLNEILFNTLSPPKKYYHLAFQTIIHQNPKRMQPQFMRHSSILPRRWRASHPQRWVLTHPLKSPPTHSVHTHTSPFPNPVSLIRLKFQTRCFRATSSGVYLSSCLPQINVYELTTTACCSWTVLGELSGNQSSVKESVDHGEQIRRLKKTMNRTLKTSWRPQMSS